jgi:hypothetical protein
LQSKQENTAISAASPFLDLLDIWTLAALIYDFFWSLEVLFLSEFSLSRLVFIPDCCMCARQKRAEKKINGNDKKKAGSPASRVIFRIRLYTCGTQHSQCCDVPSASFFVKDIIDTYFSIMYKL